MTFIYACHVHGRHCISGETGTAITELVTLERVQPTIRTCLAERKEKSKIMAPEIISSEESDGLTTGWGFSFAPSTHQRGRHCLGQLTGHRPSFPIKDSHLAPNKSPFQFPSLPFVTFLQTVSQLHYYVNPPFDPKLCQ